jgi:hypothetical protein
MGLHGTNPANMFYSAIHFHRGIRFYFSQIISKFLSFRNKLQLIETFDKELQIPIGGDIRPLLKIPFKRLGTPVFGSNA